MKKTETTYVVYEVDVSWTVANYSEGNKNIPGAQLSVANRFKQKVENVLSKYDINDVKIHVGETKTEVTEKQKNSDYTQKRYTYPYIVVAIIHGQNPDDIAPGGPAFESQVSQILEDTGETKVTVKNTDYWTQKDPHVSL